MRCGIRENGGRWQRRMRDGGEGRGMVEMVRGGEECEGQWTDDSNNCMDT